jgi:hypothetical protein
MVKQLAANGQSASAALQTFLAQQDEDANRPLLVRALLLRAALIALDRLPQLAVESSVRHFFCEAFRFIANTGRVSSVVFRPDRDDDARGLCRIAILERYPAGQLDWEVSGVPRSYLLKVPVADLPKVLYFIAAKLHGFAPCFYCHVGIRRYRLLFVERENDRSYYRMAKSMELQPTIKGVVTASWFHSSETHRVSPHLAWTTKTPCENGALITTIGLAGPKAGFSEGSRERQELYEQGKYAPKLGLIIWPRKHVLTWAARHPELAT